MALCLVMFGHTVKLWVSTHDAPHVEQVKRLAGLKVLPSLQHISFSFPLLVNHIERLNLEELTGFHDVRTEESGKILGRLDHVI